MRYRYPINVCWHSSRDPDTERLLGSGTGTEIVYRYSRLTRVFVAFGLEGWYRHYVAGTSTGSPAYRHSTWGYSRYLVGLATDRMCAYPDGTSCGRVNQVALPDPVSTPRLHPLAVPTGRGDMFTCSHLPHHFSGIAGGES
uniref:Uncharacterized protein n=1 Tax=Ananas comosus var. bracteatus TaxID=296719 RepID=A0A6V7QBG7_ANACO|nr:unnamed protein product [Ananas comosus var. bracteatus]